MLQIVQNMGSGETELLNAPAPRLDAGCVLIHTTVSLISAGTERMLVDFGRASMLQKARQQPDKVRMVLEKVRTDGLVTTIDAVRSKLDQPLALGYCNVGKVAAVGAGVTEFAPGDRVVSNGPHAGIVSVPRNLCAKIPDNVDDSAAVFTVLASIGLQGLRLVAPTLGETVVVTGLGLIGLLTVQLLRANGCVVIGIDYDKSRLQMARQFGAITIDPAAGEDPVRGALQHTGGVGVDAVIITASTKSSEPVSQAARMCRKRGRIVLVGVTGLELNRAEFYEKEISFQVSCSYGPGRYDPQYEAMGRDYPLGFVRWTEQRNFQAILDLLASSRLDPQPLISARFDIEKALEAYAQLTTNSAALGILLDYPPLVDSAQAARKVELSTGVSLPQARSGTEAVVGFIGAGNYGSRMLIPAFQRASAQLDTVVTSTGVSGVHHGRKTGFRFASTDAADVLANERINTVAIVTRHNTHADLVVRSLTAGKNVFVEKPLALTLEDVDKVRSALDAASQTSAKPLLMVGFNRRFAPLVVRMKSMLAKTSSPKAFIYTCNAGMIPADHWTQDRQTGGGRIIGEACHFIDLLRFLAGSPIEKIQAMQMGGPRGSNGSGDNAVLSLRFRDGSIGTIQYFANGGKSFPKERIEAFVDDAVLQLDNFVSLRGFSWPGFSSQKLWRQDKGQTACVAAFLQAIRTGSPSPIPADELLEVARASIQLADPTADE